jgi:integrase
VDASPISSAPDFAEDARAANTRRAYASDWADFSAWCAEAGHEDLPAAPIAVAGYLGSRAGTLTVSTLRRRKAAIRARHLDADLPAPDSAELRKVWAGIRRRLDRPPRKKKALILEELGRVVAALPPTPTGLRDKAVLLVGFAGAFRRSELAAIELDGPETTGAVRLEWVEEGAAVHLGSAASKGKTAAIVPIPITGTALCPVAALEAHLKASGIRSGPVFRGIDRWGRSGSGSLSPKSCAQIVKTACAAVGLNPRVFAGHSLRRGLATSAHRDGVDLVRIQRALRHKRAETTTGYIEEADRFGDSLGRML